MSYQNQYPNINQQPYQQQPYEAPSQYQQPQYQQPQYQQPQYQGQQQYQQAPYQGQPQYQNQPYQGQPQQYYEEPVVKKPHQGGRRPSNEPLRGSDGNAAQEIQASHGWRDWIWALIFIIQLLVVLIAGFICYKHYQDDFTHAGTDSNKPSKATTDNIGPLEHALPLLAVCLGVGCALAVLWLYLMKNHGTVLIWISLIFTLFLSGLGVVLAAFAGNLVGVIILGIFFLFNLYYVYCVRPKIPFAAAMLDVSLRAMGHFSSAWLIPVFGMILAGGWAYAFSICAMSIVWGVDKGGNDSAYSVRGLIFFLLVLSFFWTSFVIKGWVHTCIAGVQASWYFLFPHATPSSPVFGAVKRASTTSFGSICFGSFLVALIRTIRFFVNLAYQQARQSNNGLAACALCCLECIIGIIESTVNYINQYAFAICAIYGTPFMESASRAWNLMKSRGFDAVVNDSLIGGVLSFSVLIGGLVTGLVAALLAYYGYDSDWRPWAGIGFVIGALFMFVTAEVVESAVVSLFICLAEDPATLQNTKPEEYHRLVDPLNVYYPNRGQQQNQQAV